MQFIQNLDGFLSQNNWILIGIYIWILPWKGLALWKSARSGSKKWFILILLLNTMAILEILYIFIFSKKNKKEIES